MLQKSLSSRIKEAQPEWRNKFLSYKKLKKCLKLIRSNSDPAATKRPGDPLRVADHQIKEGEAAPQPMLTREEEDFMNLLAAEVDKSSAFFLEKEEEYIIRQKVASEFRRFVNFTLFLIRKYDSKCSYVGICIDSG